MEWGRLEHYGKWDSQDRLHCECGPDACEAAGSGDIWWRGLKHKLRWEQSWHALRMSGRAQHLMLRG